jgi:hypothetical protein
VVWDGLRQSPAGRSLGDRLGLTVTAPQLRDLAATDIPDSTGYAPAVALAISVLDPAGPPVDFLHSRLAPPKPATRRRQIVWAAVIAASLVLAVVLALVDQQHRRRDLTQMQDDLAKMSDEVQRAQTARDQLTYARSMASGKPRFVACMRDITAMFPDDDTIWATNLNLEANTAGQVSGKAINGLLVLALADKMRESKLFKDPKVLDLRDTGQTPRAISFSISFFYRGTE